VAGTAALAGLIAMAVWALRLKPDELRRTVYQVTDRRVLITTGIRHTWAQLDVTQCALAQPLPPEVRDGSVFMNLAWPPRGGRRYSWDQLMWPAASTDPPQLIGLSSPQAVADLICSAQLAERARTWRRTSTRIGGSEPPV